MPTIKLSDEQAKAKLAIRDYIAGSSTTPFVLNGLAGTGKTTVLAQIATEVNDAILCTLTGKAASILRKKTGLPACTIHSAFYQLIEVRKDAQGRKRPSFECLYGKGGELSGSVVLIDECSMINHEMARDILGTGAKVVACGDPGQLPPVSGKRFFDKADITLQTIHRQALESPIIRQAHRVRAGHAYESDGAKFRVTNEATDEEAMNVDAILCFTNKTKDLANREARKLRGFFQSAPQVGEPLVCLRNAPDFGIFNGAIYSLEAPFLEGDKEIRINVEDRIVTIPNVRFEGLKSHLPEHVEATTSFGFGYAMTVHKSQGSEWNSVLLLDEYRMKENRPEWLYTGITRAADNIIVVR